MVRYKSSGWERKTSILPSVMNVTVGKSYDYNENELSELESDMLDPEANSRTSMRKRTKEFDEICRTNGTWKIMLKISNNDDRIVAGLIAKVISIINRRLQRRSLSSYC